MTMAENLCIRLGVSPYGKTVAREESIAEIKRLLDKFPDELDPLA